MGGSLGWHRQQTGSSVLLEKLWTKILVEPLSRTELSQVRLVYSFHVQLYNTDQNIFLNSEDLMLSCFSPKLLEKISQKSVSCTGDEGILSSWQACGRIAA